ncbi:MAG: GNAT family N-acetyltransferase [Chloroflexi bacterium]|nr:GNAT family N-acetyltransferase [Chloroflexota bacterium]
MISPPLPARPHLSIHTYPLAKAIPLFCRLYAASFAGHAWNQPYTPDEVAADLREARDILFLVNEKRPFGFAWLHLDENKVGQIEPIGILPEGQGEGNGKYLYLAATYELKRRGAQRAIVGTWAANIPARNLYNNLDFHHQQTIIYYAYHFGQQ